MLPREHRLHRPADFTEVVRYGQRASRPLLSVHALLPTIGPAGTGISTGTGQPLDSAALRLPRAGLVVSKAVGGSVHRSTVSRRLRHLLRERLGALPPGTRLVVRAAPLSGSASSAALAADLDTAIASALRPRTGRPRSRTTGSAP